MRDRAVTLGLLVFMVLLVTCGVWLVKGGIDWERECERRGGHKKSFYMSRACLTKDGRVIEF